MVVKCQQWRDNGMLDLTANRIIFIILIISTLYLLLNRNTSQLKTMYENPCDDFQAFPSRCRDGQKSLSVHGHFHVIKTQRKARKVPLLKPTLDGLSCVFIAC